MADPVKILFEYEGAGGRIEIESMWANPTDDGFSLDNIPFFAKEIALGDVVAGRRDADGMLRYDGLISPSGHSTLRLWFAENRENEVGGVREKLRDLGCPSELSDLPRLVAVDVPPTVSYAKVKEILDGYERDGLLEYEESCLAG